MKVGGTDAAAVLVNQGQNSDSGMNFKNTKDKTNPIGNIPVSQMTNQDIIELPVSDQAVIKAIEKANKVISGANTKFEFSIHKETKQIMVKVINSETNEVIREIPPEKVLDMVAKFWEMSGIIVDERR